MIDWTLLWQHLHEMMKEPVYLMLAILIGLALLLLIVCLVSLGRNRQVKKRLEEMELQLHQVSEQTGNAQKEHRETLKNSLGDLRGDMTRVMGDVVRMQKEHSGEIERRLHGQQINSEEQLERLSELSQTVQTRLDQSNEKLEMLSEKVSLPAVREEDSRVNDCLAQGLRLVSEQLQQMTRQLEALEKGQRLLQQAQVPVEEPVLVAPVRENERPAAAPTAEPPRYETSSWD